MTKHSAVLLLALMVCGVRAAAGDWEIRGTVSDSQGLRVRAAELQVRNPLTGAMQRGVTDDEGRFVMVVGSGGTYRVRASATDLGESAATVTLREGKANPSLELVLSPAATYAEVTVYSGSRVEELREESPQKVDVLTREQIESTGYERVSDVLSEVPGVVTRSGSTANVGAEQVQGIDSRQVLVLQDGLPIVGARGIKRGALNLNRQSAARLDRVEVVKGAASPLFGSDAIGGVINMITREPSRPLEGNVNVSGGSLGMFDARAGLGTRLKRLSLLVDLEHHRQDAYTLLPSSPTTVGPDWRRNDLFWRSRYRFNDRAALSFHATAYHNREKGRNLAETGITSGVSEDSTQNYALIGDFLPTNSTTVQLRGYAARYDESSLLTLVGSNAPPSPANLNQRYRRMDGMVSQQLGTRHLLQGGYEWAQDEYFGANRLVGDNAGQQVTTNDVWLQDRVQLTRWATLNLGGRVTSHSLFGTWAVPKAGLVVRLGDRWVARGSFGRGFRAPDLGQLFFRFANPASFYQVIGNPNLQAETSRSFSTGISYVGNRFRAGVNLYRNDVGNLIEAINVGFPATPGQLQGILNRYQIPSDFNPLLNRLTFVYLNFGRIYTQGFELDAELRLHRDWRVAGAYTFLHPVDRGTGLHLAQRHRHQGFTRLDYANTQRGLFVNLRGTFFSDWLLNPAQNTRAFGFAMWDLYGAKRLPRGLEFYGAVDNLANSRDRKLHDPTPTFDRPDFGRTYRIGMRYAFGRDE
jgi:outer membrane receptor for ferrienterochelin and colicins